MKTQGEQVDCMARSGLLSLTTGQHYNSHTNELNTRPKQTDKTQIKSPNTHRLQHKLIFTRHSIIKINTFN